MAVDIKKVITSLKERKETMLVWGLGAVALCLGVFLLLGHTREASPPPSLEVVVKRKKPLKSKEEITEEAITKLKETQKISPFVDYQDILTKNLFIQSRMAQVGDERIIGAGGFVLKGMIRMPDEIKAFINDPAGKPHLVGTGQRIGTSEVKVVAIDFENQSVTLMGKGWEKPQVIRLAKVEIEKAGGVITFKPSERKEEVEKTKEVTEKEAKRAITAANLAISKVASDIVDASATGVDTWEAEEEREKAKKKLTQAQEAYLIKEYTTAQSLALEAEKIAKEAILLVEEAIEKEEEEEEEE